MNRRYLLPEKGNFYKANLHSHTVYSDGKLTPEESKRAYMEQGYSILAFTDHRIYRNHRELNDDHFVALAAYEADLYNNTGEKEFTLTPTYHLNFYDTNPSVFREEKEKSPAPSCGYEDMEGINRYLEQQKELGFIACYNHPYWSLQNYDDYKNLKGLFAMEIYNYGCELDGLYGYSPQVYDELLRLNNPVFCIAADDNHNLYPFDHPLSDSFGGFTMMKMEELTYSSVIESMLNGNFYSTMGPEIKEFYIEGNEAVVAVSPVEKIYLITDGRDCYKKLAGKGEFITGARFPLTGRETYIRLQIRSKDGKYANSNAYFLHALHRRQ